MGTIEQYWDEYIKRGFTRQERDGRIIYTMPPDLGEGGFEIWGDTRSVMATVVDMTLYKPMIFVENVSERYIQFSQFYSGNAEFYQKRSDVFPIDHGLNFLVHHTGIFGYKKVDAGVRLNDVGLCYRSRFFETLPFALPADFWETAANVLNPDVLTFPQMTLICEQLRTCRLTGDALSMFVHGKAFEALSLMLDYVYQNRKEPPVILTDSDRTLFEEVKLILKHRMADPPGIGELASMLGMNQRKLMLGFKYLNEITIYGYLKHIRMERAAELLREREVTISEVARAVGYHGDGHFQRAFRDIYGIAPNGFRKTL